MMDDDSISSRFSWFLDHLGALTTIFSLISPQMTLRFSLAVLAILGTKSFAFIHPSSLPKIKTSLLLGHGLQNHGGGLDASVVPNHADRSTLTTITDNKTIMTSRRGFVATTIGLLFLGGLSYLPDPASAKCKDIETCREIGEQKDAAKVAANPIIRLGNGLQYKVLTAGVGDAQVTDDTDMVVKIAYSVSQASGSYMYSQGFGYNKIDAGNGKQISDLGMDGLTVHFNNKNNSDNYDLEIPIGVRRAMVGMKRGEKRRIEVPPQLGFETRYVCFSFLFVVGLQGIIMSTSSTT